MIDPTITDLRRELEKARHALIDAQSHLASHAEMNAALHCATTVMYSPLHAKVTAAIQQIEHALQRTEPGPNPPTLDSRSSDGVWAALVADLDRCQHGRHHGDPCGPADACTGTSAGNPHLRPGAVIGYGIYGHPIVMPDRDHKHDPAAWRVQNGDEQQ
jgi:hypothetical protein